MEINQKLHNRNDRVHQILCKSENLIYLGSNIKSDFQ